MKAALALLALLALPSAPSVAVHDGNIVYTGANGISRTLTKNGNNADPVLSPDGKTVAFIHMDKAADEIGWGEIDSLWIAEVPTGSARRLMRSHRGSTSDTALDGFSTPIFSLDGGYLYVTARYSEVTAKTQQVSLKTGKDRFVTGGGVTAVIRTGKYRGYLLIQYHEYRPEGGSYNPIHVVRPDGKVLFRVPGSDKDDGERSVARWLAGQGIKAW